MFDFGFKYFNILIDIYVYVIKWCWMYVGNIIFYK